MPVGGKLTFIYDCDGQRGARLHAHGRRRSAAPWRMDFASPCGVTLTFTRGTRYCTIDDVKAGNAEVLSSCHRLRSRDVAMQAATVKGTVELQRHDRRSWSRRADGKHVSRDPGRLARRA